MVFYAILISIIAIGLFIVCICYRRQVKITCRQLAFLKEHETNMRLTSELPSSRWNELVDDMNEIIDKSREVQRMAQANENLLKDTITNLSHDIRTPLTSLDGYFQLLSESTSEEDRERYLTIIQSRITSLREILEELFTYTKLQNENYELALEKVDFTQCVHQTLFSFYEDFKTKFLEPEVDFCEEPLRVMGNEEALKRILQNLIKNSLIHGEKQVSLTLLKEEEFAVFCCANDIGNPEEVDETQAFTRFYKADAARHQNSTGLGLSIAKELTEKMGGNITAKLTNHTFSIEIKIPLCMDSFKKSS